VWSSSNADPGQDLVPRQPWDSALPPRVRALGPCTAEFSHSARQIRRILGFLLDQRGFVTSQAADGVEAVEMARRESPDLILLDLMMPRMDGFEVCEALRSDFATAQIPVIMLTAKGEVTDKVRGLQGGANDYLTKPYDNKELIARIQNMLEWSRVQRQANPLTGLPGNQAIEKRLQVAVASQDAFSFMYLDIDHFKAFNDSYGYQRGDDAIRFTADLLRDCVEQVAAADAFIGHIGGDDFCLVCAYECGEKLAQTVIKRFAGEVESLIDPKDLERGYLKVHSRQAGIEEVPFPSLTIALVLDRGGEFEHWRRLSDVAAELKAHGKTLSGNVVVKERRQSSSGAHMPVSYSHDSD
jgi:diguanylate cyclase (GGDEF)-like protein